MKVTKFNLKIYMFTLSYVYFCTFDKIKSKKVTKEIFWKKNKNIYTLRYGNSAKNYLLCNIVYIVMNSTVNSDVRVLALHFLVSTTVIPIMINAFCFQNSYTSNWTFEMVPNIYKLQLSLKIGTYTVSKSNR